MKKIVYFALTVIMVFLVSGFVMAEEITIVGTGSGMSLLQAVGDAFSQKNPDVKVIVPESIGSSGGIKSVGADKYRIGRVARELKDTEKPYGLTYVPFAKLPIVFFVNKSSSIKDATPRQLCDIYSGKITNWKELGGEDSAIRVIRREDGDSSLQVLIESFPGFKDVTITPKSKTTFTDQETLSLTEQKSETIAFGTSVNAQNYDVITLSIEGKKATDADYPYYGVLALIFKEANNTGNIKKFIDFAKSPEAHDTIKQAGGLPY